MNATDGRSESGDRAIAFVRNLHDRYAEYHGHKESMAHTGLTIFAGATGAALDRSASQLQDGAHDEDLAAGLESLAAPLNDDSGDAITNKRRAALSETLNGIAARRR